MRNVSNKTCTEHQNTYFKFNNFLFFLQNRAVYDTMYKNSVEPDRPQTTIWLLRIACWILKVTHLQYVVLNAFPLHNGYTNAPQCYVTRTLPVLFVCVLRAPVDVNSVVCILCWFYDWSFAGTIINES